MNPDELTQAIQECRNALNKAVDSAFAVRESIGKIKDTAYLGSIFTLLREDMFLRRNLELVVDGKVPGQSRFNNDI